MKAARRALPPVAVLAFSVFAWMIAQGLLGTSRTLQERGSSDLLFSSPLPVRLVLASRATATAASSFGSVGLLVLPVANMAALLDGPAWLAAYPALLALSLDRHRGGTCRRHRPVPRARRAPRPATRSFAPPWSVAHSCWERRSRPCCPQHAQRRRRY